MSATDKFGAPSQLRVTLVRSLAGEQPRARRTVRALGLRRVGSTKVHKSSPDVLGMLRSASHLLKVEPAGASGIEGERTHAPIPRRSEVRITSVNRYAEDISVSFLTGMTVKQADAAITAAAHSVSPAKATAVVWDDHEARVREFSTTNNMRPWTSVKGGRLALLRFDGPDWMAGFEVPLTRPTTNVEMFVHCEPKALPQALKIVQGLAGKALASDVEAHLAKGTDDLSV